MDDMKPVYLIMGIVQMNDIHRTLISRHNTDELNMEIKIMPSVKHHIQNTFISQQFMD